MHKIIQGKDFILVEKDKELYEKNIVISENAKIIDELMRKLSEK